MDQIKIGKFIAEERKAKKYTQRELADKLSISDKTISKWERGEYYGTAEPPVRCGESHLSGLTEPLHFVY